MSILVPILSTITMMMMISSMRTVNAFGVAVQSSLATGPTTTTTTTRSRKTVLFAVGETTTSGGGGADESANALLERARKMRAEIAALEGKTLEDVEAEAREKKEATQQRQLELEEARKASASDDKERRLKKMKYDGSYLEVPETADDLVYQAASAVERAFADGLTRQTVRLCYIREGENLLMEDRQWPGGAKQMYREAAGPLTRDLLSQIKAPTAIDHNDDEDIRLNYSPNVTSQDLWDFDGSALITATSQAGPSADVQALVQPNTDSRYLKDIQKIDEVMKERLFLIVNPFWRDVDSWGFDILSPGAKKLAQSTIFDSNNGRGYEETYHVIQKTVRGVDCVAVKAYPYDWQLFAYTNKQDAYYTNYAMRLGSTKEEPKSSNFYELLKERPDEFEFRIM